MRTEYKVVKPFGCAKRDDIFKTEDGIEYVMESTNSNDKYTNSRYMMITANYVLELLNGGNLKEWGEEIEDETNTDEEYIPSDAELKLIALEAFLDDCTKKYQDNIQKVNEDYKNGKIQPCVKVESETVNYNLLKFIKAVKQILDVDKTNE